MKVFEYESSSYHKGEDIATVARGIESLIEFGKKYSYVELTEYLSLLNCFLDRLVTMLRKLLLVTALCKLLDPRLSYLP